ncbi:IgGFc-binding protein-like [Asterias rubens]|uniref:IgGFc-binding protein-like n=1 Tax=Asterias rubens TaxID=7604 RepID=UPI001454EAD9|nr:IgGFc-binding protein-like [Asterias rubens]
MLPTVFILVCCGGFLGDSAVSALQTNVGREFIFGFAENYRPNADPSVIITNMSPLDHENVTVHISTPVHGLLQTVHLQGLDSSKQITLPRELVPYGESPDLSVIIVNADDDIAVYAINDAHDRSMDGFTVLPKRSLGTEYFVATYEPSLSSQMLFIATEDDTVIHIQLSNHVVYKKIDVQPGRLITIDASKYEVFLLESDKDLSGTKITSNKPLAVLSGNRCAFVPVGVLTCDHLAEMLPPFTQWGKTFVIMTFLGRSSGDIYRVIAGRDNTEVTVKSQTFIVKEKEFRDFEILHGQTSFIQSDKPVLVIQYAKSFAADNVNGDPAMTIVPPMEQSVNLVKLPTYNTTKDLQTVENYVNIYAPCKEMYYSNLTLDGEVIRDIVSADRIVRVDRSDYCAVGFHIDHGMHTVAPGPQGFESFVAIAYGFAQGNSYAWPAGLATTQIVCEYLLPSSSIQYYDCRRGIIEVHIPCNVTEVKTIEECINTDCVSYDNLIFICAGVAVAAMILLQLFRYFVIGRTSLNKQQIAFGQTGLPLPPPPPEITIAAFETPSSPPPELIIRRDSLSPSMIPGSPMPSPNTRRTSRQERADRMRKK